jgi:hypothetical protein
MQAGGSQSRCATGLRHAPLPVISKGYTLFPNLRKRLESGTMWHISGKSDTQNATLFSPSRAGFVL